MEVESMKLHANSEAEIVIKVEGGALLMALNFSLKEQVISFRSLSRLRKGLENKRIEDLHNLLCLR